MWSYSYTGNHGLVKDSFQRIGLFCSTDDVISENYLKLVSMRCNGMSHIYLDFDFNSHTDKHSLVRDRIHFLKTINAEYFSPIHITVQLGKTENIDIAASIVCKYLNDADTFVFCYQGTRQFTEAFIDLLHESLQNNNKKAYTFGISGTSPDDVQWILEKSKVPVGINVLDNLCPPNMQLRTIEFLHSKGCNTIVIIRNPFPHDLSYLTPLIEKYNREGIAILSKVLLQLGVLVMISMQYDELYLLTEILPLAHPMQYRPYVGDTIALSIKSYEENNLLGSANTPPEPSSTETYLCRILKISTDDMTSLEELSETSEAEGDSSWMAYR